MVTIIPQGEIMTIADAKLQSGTGNAGPIMVPAGLRNRELMHVASCTCSVARTKYK